MVDEDVCDRPVVVVRRDPGPTLLLIHRKLFDRGGLVVGNRRHSDAPKRLPSRPFDASKRAEVLGAGGPDHVRMLAMEERPETQVAGQSDFVNLRSSVRVRPPAPVWDPRHRRCRSLSRPLSVTEVPPSSTWLLRL